MSLWLQSAIEALEFGRYGSLRQQLIPCAPFTLPSCLIRELEYGESHCGNIKTDRLYPIRFLWVLEAIEQRNWGLEPGARCIFNPESLYGVWLQITSDHQFRKDCEASGSRFDFVEKAMESSHGWVYMGDSFIEDFLEIEEVAEVEMLFPSNEGGDPKPAFQEIKASRKKPM